MRFTNANINIVFEEEVLRLFEQHRQLTGDSLEAGGQLFARFSDGDVSISKATGLREGDKRGRFLFWPNRVKEQDEIKKLHGEGFHYVGDWHTHPEPIPKPSKTDIANIADCYRKSSHALKYFTMVIVGTAPFPDGINVSIHNGSALLFLRKE